MLLKVYPVEVEVLVDVDTFHRLKHEIETCTNSSGPFQFCSEFAKEVTSNDPRHIDKLFAHFSGERIHITLTFQGVYHNNLLIRVFKGFTR